ncbi:MAG: NlpC/P60 family protein [Solirubrobacteraceae bacterium]
MTRTVRGVLLGLALTLLAVPTASAQTAGSGGVSGATTTTEPSDDATTSRPDDAVDDETSSDEERPTGTEPRVSQTKTVKLTRSQSKRVQRKVRVRADGKIGAGTRKAIRRYQQRRDLKRTGRPNLETLRKMRLSFADTIERKLAGTTSTEDSDAGTTTAASGDVAGAIDAARSKIGTPYASGGNGPSSFDCSGLTVWAFKQIGVDLPRTSFEQYREGTSVAKADIQPGDLVFFNTAGSGASHVGIATSATKVISATTSGVKEHRIDDSYWGSHYVGARRLS